MVVASWTFYNRQPYLGSLMCRITHTLTPSPAPNGALLPFVALAVHQRVHTPIECAVLLLEARYPERTGKVVLATATVGARPAAHLGVALGRVALAAPLGARHAHQAAQVATLAAVDGGGSGGGGIRRVLRITNV